MRLLEIWVASPLAGAVGWTLLHSLWEGAIISAALGTVLLATRSPRARYAAACAALAAMLAAFGLTLFCMMPEGVNGPRILYASSLPAWNVRSGLGALDVSNSRFGGMVPWLPFWIAGVWIFSLRQLIAWISASRLRSRGVCIAPERLQKDLTRLRAQLRVSRPVLLLESCIVDVPMVLGHFRPIILMPLGQLAGLPAGQIDAILAHELAHIRRCDYLVNLLQRVMEGLLFYHPAVWWVGRVIRTERENCCDDVAIATSGNAHDYAVALAALEQRRWPLCDTAVAATGGILMKRIRRLLYPRRPNGAWTPLFAALALIVIASVTLAAWQAAPSSRGSAATPTAPWLLLTSSG
ncbi:MAG: M56 family metallopeptidase [Bryobacteraceae bacterium]